ncbi:hypothetical protein JOF48_000534 [Arthrobacter stackebrandtii]|uniref:Uncharacterized protein n=1 Tax=Arthrobacter stackebrandtii TaxID=272161 RepID=A0ABS4YT27_9MICC|nr:ABC transporter ATP-binding protein [Arthrobacter stackebrandtii]MBP2411735.1 hypothetical protein [Arthrobacter stackebrandtii]PYG99630.1 hypothetical protein CVV67_13825 [Arthrobacter stackebrandtii]
MAYPMSRAVPGAESVPLPTSPVVWAGYASRALRASLGTTLLWALAVTMLGFFSPLRMGRVVDDVARLVPAVLFVIFVVGALSLGREIGRAFKYVLGYGRLKRTSEFHGHTVVPRRGLRLKRGATLLGVLLGMGAAGIIRAAVQDWVMALLLGGLAIVLVIPTVKVLRLARIMWRQAIDVQRTNGDIVRDGEHSTGVVVAVTYEDFIVDGRAMFHVDLEYRTGGRQESARIRFHDYPVWAPAVGNVFDVWSDPERPFVQERILLERRYVDQVFVPLDAEPVSVSHAAGQEAVHRIPAPERTDSDSGLSGGITLADTPDGTVAGNPAAKLLLQPQWAADESHAPATHKAARRTRFLIGLPPNLIAALALAGTLLVPAMIENVPWWTLAALWLYTALTVTNAALYWQFMLRTRWFVRSGVSFGATEAAVFAGFFAAGFAMLATDSMVMAPLHQELAWTPAHVLTWAAVIGALLVFEWAFTSNAWALKHLNAEYPAPPEAIQEALTCHDPDGIDRLERDYGYRAGVFLCD